MPRAVQSVSADPFSMELHQRVERARQDYERVVAAARQLIEQVGSEDLQNPARLAAVRNARRIQEMATQRYTEALRVFSDFVLGRQNGNRSH